MKFSVLAIDFDGTAARNDVLDADVRAWFEPAQSVRRRPGRRQRRRAAAVPKTTVPRDLIERSLAE